MAQKPAELSELIIPRGRAGGVDPSSLVEGQGIKDEPLRAVQAAAERRPEGQPQQSVGARRPPSEPESEDKWTRSASPLTVVPEQSLRVPVKMMQVKLRAPVAQRLKILSASLDKTQQELMELWITSCLDEAWRRMNNQSE